MRNAILTALVGFAACSASCYADNLALEALLQRRAMANLVVIQQQGQQHFAQVSQEGDANIVQLLQLGSANSAMLWQEGDNNQVTLTQRGSANQAVIIQRGNDNHIELTQLGQARFSIEQQGQGASLSVIQY